MVASVVAFALLMLPLRVDTYKVAKCLLNKWLNGGCSAVASFTVVATIVAVTVDALIQDCNIAVVAIATFTVTASAIVAAATLPVAVCFYHT